MWDLAFLGGAVLFFSPFVSVLLFFRWVAWGLGFFFFLEGECWGFFVVVCFTCGFFIWFFVFFSSLA